MKRKLLRPVPREGKQDPVERKGKRIPACSWLQEARPSPERALISCHPSFLFAVSRDLG